MRTDVYFNLHKLLWSMRGMNPRRVVSHVTHLSMKNVTFVVSEAGRQKVLKEKRKNVHAYARGEATSYKPKSENFLKAAGYRQAYYNPYKVKTFIDKITGQPLQGLYRVYMKAQDKSVWYKEQK